MALEVVHRLAGWRLVWLEVELVAEDVEVLASARASAVDLARRDLEPATLAEVPMVAAMRRLFREAGTDPTRYRPSSEALLRRVLKGEALPAIHPLVDVNNCLSIALAVPCCVMAEGSIEGPVTLRRGEAGERMDSLRGPFELEGKPLLADRLGPFGTPITDSRRVAVQAATRRARMVAYLPATAMAERVMEAYARLELERVAHAAVVATSGP